MPHSLTTSPPTSTPISTKSKKRIHIPSVCFLRNWSRDQHSNQVLDDHKLIHRRNVTLGLAGAVLGLNVVGDRNANAAARRPPPPPPKEKKDPNVSGVLAKVLASKKRKEAMKQVVSKLRETGKTVNEPSE